ncbi:polysaccharide pyruvyl transferase family protein [Methanosarcina mazei]|uniref:Polysaccharide pyruvyl transferase n=1 Tax=Methanosarcina mazei TaxID=2209 RepID=A0A0F8KRA9_METMZ|nr:polysaccharide pyruvyl transferase family protein [Methanosarcina mazei]KKH16918.1 polysaccharide pyruvyl transferase [Methanosarcina mazei]KKH18723.1 polysaccharide pyruvyl transferase [Methanosarcina mazei]KKH20822.1 polysaccharide pyruvyl transferase [Methanosarcina mazei]
MNERPIFILAGNGPYENRGCEAIVRGTVKILRHYYKDPSFVCVSFFHSDEQYKRQCEQEFDKNIIHKRANQRAKLFDLNWSAYRILKVAKPEIFKNWTYKEMLPYIKDCHSVLSLGGDNYSLDYGIPERFTILDDLAIKNGKSIVIWGASIGPFNKLPEYEQYMINHLQKVDRILARESSTIKYLKEKGIDNNLYKVGDPAFLMDPVEPKELEDKIEDGAIGINFSPLMAKYVTGGDRKKWVLSASEIITYISEKTRRKIYLIPHVTSPLLNSDYEFLKSVQEKVDLDKNKLVLIPPRYNAAETKWIISKMFVFAGARTHSTIAALSSCIPTLSFAYSIKAKGINNDIFANEDYCLNPEDLNAELVSKKIELLIENNTQIRKNLQLKIPEIKKEALDAGKYLIQAE